VLGRSIAHAFALGGYRTILEDLLPSSLRKAELEFRVSVDRAVNSGRVRVGDVPSALSRLEYAASVEEAARIADFVIETLPEELESKSEIFILLDKICRPATILATSTTTLSVTQLAAVTYRATKCVGMRFIFPVHDMQRLEVVRGLETGEETIGAASALVRRLGMDVTVVEEMAPSSPKPVS
jgi:3-hydroxybutyryl-CoA dehydrogenase